MTAWCSVDEAAATIADGAWLAPGGFMLGRAPMTLVFGLIRAGRSDLRMLPLPNPLPAELLVAAGAAARIELLFGALLDNGTVIRSALEPTGIFRRSRSCLPSFLTRYTARSLVRATHVASWLPAGSVMAILVARSNGLDVE